MRRILIERARSRAAICHGAGQIRVAPEEVENRALNPATDDRRLIALDEALAQFAPIDARKAERVKLRYFAGLSIEEVAKALDISEPTAKRWWTFSRAWLFQAMT